MADIVIATAIIAFTFFFLSVQSNLAEWARRLFQLVGFLTVLLTIGIEMTSASEGFMVVVLWIYSTVFVLTVLIDLLFLVVAALKMTAEAGD